MTSLFADFTIVIPSYIYIYIYIYSISLVRRLSVGELLVTHLNDKIVVKKEEEIKKTKTIYDEREIFYY